MPAIYYYTFDLIVFNPLIQFSQYFSLIFAQQLNPIIASILQIAIFYAKLFMKLSTICLLDFAYDFIHSL
jgi:hypothetical protein